MSPRTLLNTMLFLDVETNGIGSFRPPNQRVVQIAWIYKDKKKSFFINDVEEVSEKVPHPYNVEFLKMNGISFNEGIIDFMNDIRECELIVAHNSNFDIGCLKNEFLLRGFPINYNRELDFKKVLCTMKSTIEYCKIPFQDKSRKSNSSFKWPKLEELYYTIFRETPDIILHDALNDCIITQKCVRYLLNNDVLKI